MAIPEWFGSATSKISIVGCDQAALATAKIAVDITHPYRGDLLIDLLAPDGTVYNLKTQKVDDEAPYSATTYTVDLSAEQGTGGLAPRGAICTSVTPVSSIPGR